MTPNAKPEPSPEYRYHVLRAATERFQCNIASLEPSQRDEAETLARRTFDLETLVLTSDEARAVVIPEGMVVRALDAVRERYESESELVDDLARNGLDTDVLRRALRRELTFDAVMQRVGARFEPVSETDLQLFYELHRERFSRPERRRARHILITINDEFADNTRAAARARIDRLARELREPSADEGLVERFERLARRHSECPSALEGGSLGSLPRGKLYPAVDAALFELEEGEVSPVVESPIGLHLIFCEQIEPADDLTLQQARPRLQEALEARRRRDAQRTWIDGLRRRRPIPA
jgi:peptidyl-prolyl cis-trans isomerase C